MKAATPLAVAVTIAATAAGITTATAASPSTGAVAPKAMASAAHALPRINVTTNGKTMTVGGSLVSGAVDVVTVTSREPVSNPVFIRLNRGVSYAQVFHLLMSPAGQDPNVVRRVGAIVFDANAKSGRRVHVQVNLAPGRYLGLDVVALRSGAAPPFAKFTIARSAHPAMLPKATGGTVRAIEFAFRGNRTLRSGQWVRWRNNGYLVHMFVVFRSTKAFPAREIARLLRQGKDRQLPNNLGTLAGAGPLSWRAAQQQRLLLKPGRYVVACFMDTQDGREHTTLGMERILRVVR
ncbi:MAG: hypothetical protein ACRDP1_13640 [Nocardioidaceae bacterium]